MGQKIMVMMRNSKHNILAGHRGIVVLCTIILLVAGCSKSHEGEYYNYQNKNAVYDGSTYAFLKSQGGLYDSLLYVIDRVSNLKDTIEKFDITLFAPTNQCFTNALNNLNELRSTQHKTPLYLNNINLLELDTLLCRYVIPGNFVTDSLNKFTDGIVVNSLRYDYQMHLRYNRQDANGYQNGGPQEIEFSDPKNSIFERYWVTTYTTSVNIHTDNGVVHLLSGGHEFGFGEFSGRMNK